MSETRPNVLVIMVDQMKATASHLYGGDVATAALEALAGEGVLYDRAYTPHPLCVPARIALWTACYSHRTGARTNESEMPRESWHAFHLWREAGFVTALIGKNHCFDLAADQDLFDVWCEISHTGLPGDGSTKGMDWRRPIDAIDAAHATRRQMPNTGGPVPHAITHHPREDYSTALVAAQTIEFLERHQDRPFAAWVSFPDPHSPYEVPASYGALFPPDRIELPPSPDKEFDQAPERNRVLAEILRWNADEIDRLKAVVAAYHAMVRFIDDEVGRILSTLDRLGLRESTIVAFCSDHGDFAGEHRMMGKGGVFYDCLTRVPLVLSGPGLPRTGVVERSPVSLIDVVPTILSLQGFDLPPDLDGRPLPGVRSASPRRQVFAEYGLGAPAFGLDDLRSRGSTRGLKVVIETLPQREYEGLRAMVCDGRWKYVHDPMGDLDELYDLASDPWEIRNLAVSPAHEELGARMRRDLLAWRPALDLESIAGGPVR